MMKNKKGWLKIVEAFVSILLIMIVALIVIGRSQAQEQNIDEKIYDIQTDILREIIMNNKDLIIEYDDPAINEIVDARTPNYLNCETKTCAIEDSNCEIDGLDSVLEENKNVYVQVIPLISTNLEDDEVKLMIGCWI
jgi:hypothetical protein